MTKLVARLVLAMLILPLSGTAFVLSLGVMVARGGPPLWYDALAVWVVVYIFVGVYWILLWRSLITWTPRRRLATGLSALAAILVAAVTCVLMFHVFGVPDMAVSVLVGGGVGPPLWVLATVLIWRETAEERLQRLGATSTDAVFCPICSYNMTGLREARCPECGSRFSLDELVKSQPHRDRATLPDQ
jgi:DNA-directed RNA polymerase subunit RPC12/RpoP